MEKIIKTVYTIFYQTTTGISFRKQVVITSTTIIFMLTITLTLIDLIHENCTERTKIWE